MKVTRKNNTIKVVAEAGDMYCSDLIGKAMCRLRNNGNGWDVKFYSYSSVYPDVRLNLGYDQLVLLAKAYDPTCLKNHKPRFYLPRSVMDMNCGYKRKCADFEEIK